ncbi:hypothetical protein ACMU_08555 [Actibacterium mucosum KCTC 23349]|uniref:DUF1826 domain-containing protein n=1 Tax=Actibacterium mucosum KCTC 23349 TaxID=1454373 RepID=A0A037ZH91_9RHOB|nr:DUF1826 domain-containing protein [Actibacterium mucosum]KAJ55815.1 hypothetical protein ACMU_08555 [Actibacterium mucosum KCTC 23349]
MTLDMAVTTPTDLATAVRKGRSPDAFAEIRQPGCGAAIYDRAPEPHAIEWLAKLPADLLPQDRVILAPEAVRGHVLSLMPLVSATDAPARDWLVDDIAQLSRAFANLMEAPYLRLRLDAITTNACRKFHIDAVTARLVCTYRGQATQYGMAERGHVPNEIESVPSACPVVLRGTRWPDDAPTGLLHRSPPIEGTGETRLLLVLDPIYDLADED